MYNAMFFLFITQTKITSRVLRRQ